MIYLVIIFKYIVGKVIKFFRLYCWVRLGFKFWFVGFIFKGLNSFNGR